MALVGVSFAVVLLQTSQLTDRFQTGELTTGVGVRSALNGAAWDMFLEEPLLGTGVFTFALRYPLYRTLGDQSTFGLFAHNDYLQLAVETGPWLLVVLLVILIAAGRRAVATLLRGEARSLADFGWTMAVVALLAHALVNFTFYVLPVGLAFAVVCAELFGSDRGVRQGEGADTHEMSPAWSGSLAGATSWCLAMAVGIVAWAYLALDTATQGIFGGQPAPAALRALRQDPPALLRFARLAQGLDESRATPVLGEALVLAAMARAGQGRAVPKAEILALHRRAIELDPYNAFAYARFYYFLKEFADEGLLAELRPSELPDALLLRAVQLDVWQVDEIHELLRLYDRLGLSAQALDMLRSNVFPWLERIHWKNPVQAKRLAEEIRGRALAEGDQALADAVVALGKGLPVIGPPTERVWLKEWQQRVLNG